MTCSVKGLAVNGDRGVILKIKASLHGGGIVAQGLFGENSAQGIERGISRAGEFLDLIDEPLDYAKGIHLDLYPKDVPIEGSSLCVAVCVAVVGARLNIVLDEDICFTGDIDDKGRLVSVQGISTKLSTAREKGYLVYLPAIDYDFSHPCKQLGFTHIHDLLGAIFV